MLDGFDFTERFVNETGVMAYFDVYAHLGSDQTNALFQHGAGTLANVRSVTQTTAPPINYTQVLGGNGQQSGQQDLPSQATYGYYPIKRDFQSIITQSVLDDRALSLLRLKPIVTVGLVPETNAPRPFDDFYLGDTVHAYVDRGALQINTPVRVNGFTVVIDDNGVESAEIADPFTPDEEAAITAGLEVEVVS
jgi:hypothetical protein